MSRSGKVLAFVAIVFAAACDSLIAPLDEASQRPDVPEEEAEWTSWIYLADADGTNLRSLVQGDWPSWSPDGQRLAFERDEHLYTIRADGSGETALGPGRWPAWAPDGERIAFAGESGIEVMRTDGSGVTLLVGHGVRSDTYAEWDMGVGKPSWAPDGSRLAFEHLGDGDVIPAQIFTARADGSEPRRVTPAAGVNYAESDPSWSPDGREIFFWSYGYGIARVKSDGGIPVSLYRNFPAVAYGAKPVPSPDGGTILFSASVFSPEGRAVWTMGAHGGSPRLVIASAGNAAWSPDGARIAFSRTERRAAAIGTR